MKDVIQKLRNDAHEIALQRRKEWWDAMTPAQQKLATQGILDAEIGESEHLEEFKPGVIELDMERAKFDPYSLQLQLIMVSCFVPLEEIAKRTREERIAASYWAVTCSLNASDNDVMIGPRPEWLPSRDASHADDALQEDYAKHGGINNVELIWGDSWIDPDAPEAAEADYEIVEPDRAALLDALEHVDEARTIIRKALGLDPE